MAKALRQIPKLMGKSYKTGDEIPAAVIAQLTPQSLQALVNNRIIEVDGVDPKGGGANTHLAAKVDQHHDRLKKVEAADVAKDKTITALEKRLSALEAGKTAKPAKAPRAKA
jgi:hypothetical protein